MVAATGGSTNAGLHLPAIAHEAGIRFTLDDMAEVLARTPLIADLKPGGQYVAKDVFAIGGVPVILRALLEGGYLHGHCLTVTGQTLAESLRLAPWSMERSSVALLSPLLHWRCGGAEGNLCPDGALLKVAGLHSLTFEGAALVFDNEEECMHVVRQRSYAPGSVIIIRYEGPKGGPGMREMLGITALLYGQGMGEQVALLTDGRFSGRRAVCALDTLAQRQRWVAARPGAKRRQDSYRCGGEDHSYRCTSAGTLPAPGAVAATGAYAAGWHFREVCRARWTGKSGRRDPQRQRAVGGMRESVWYSNNTSGLVTSLAYPWEPHGVDSPGAGGQHERLGAQGGPSALPCGRPPMRVAAPLSHYFGTVLCGWCSRVV